jgi:hypothetical protein
VTGAGEVPFGLAEKPRPVADAMEEIAGMNEIYGLRIVEPVFLRVVDFKDEVRRDPATFR